MAIPTMTDAGMWNHAERRNARFIGALQRGDVSEVRNHMSALFQCPLINGLGRFHGYMAAQLRTSNAATIQLQFTDALVSLAEAVGAARVTSFEQDARQHAHALDQDLDALLRRIEERTGLQLDFPNVGGAYGCTAAGRRLAIDSLIHGYTVRRLCELGARPDWRFMEIGGGYGCLAALMHRNGFANYAIYDLPWVNAIQGYFLIMAHPERQVRLFGEAAGDLQVLPYSQLFELPAQSVDAVINTDSLPEVGAPMARKYVANVCRIAKRFFFSINQEAKAAVESFEPQQCVAELVEESAGLTCLSRQRYWMRPGYVEEVYVPVPRQQNNPTRTTTLEAK
jgi:hypothetical protein